MKIREIALKLEIPKSTVHEIVHDTLGFRKVSARWVPKMLTDDHKLQMVEISQRLLQRCQQDNGDEDTTHIGVGPGGDFQANNNLFDNLITGDGTWFHLNTPETKRDSMMTWKHPSSPVTKKFKVQRSAAKVMATVFWDAKDLAPSDFHLFGPLKRHLGGMAIETEDDLISELRNWFDNLDVDFFRLLRGKEILQRQKDSGNNNNAMNNGYLIPVDKQLAPRVIDIDRWKTILIALGFEIEQPDGYHSIEHVDVFIGEGVMIAALDGMLLLLSLINSLHWDILRMVFTFTPEEAANLSSLIETTGPEFLDQQQVLAKAFLSRYPDEMRKLGLRKEHRKIVKRVFDLQQAQLCKTLSLVLTAIFQEGPPDTATFI
ncbi:histone-lysine N-methyltransferase SETMAR-like protein [Plakobranchus ocellatus]|uniref:Histone-lysine N-methyltransferase SETMAR-like protein n=1 Tax=Plakobranchus ocellatus TaxID=259542 RepID=A0AAV4BIV7_9GAST|nr:histone-lysine N-methyltransferase SETMAR-like protein [Plakobranchus ocellatus]